LKCSSSEVSLQFHLTFTSGTGYGVSESVRHFYNIYGGDINGKRVIIQGWGNVGATAAYYLSQAGAIIVGVIDRAGGIISSEGLEADKVADLFFAKRGNSLVSDDAISFDEVNKTIWDIKADVFLPCAASRLVTQDQVERMINAGVTLISSGANVPFADKAIFYGPIAEYVDTRITLIPDFIANCGMARVFAYLMSDSNVDMSDKGIFRDTSEVICRALEATHKIHSGSTLLTETAFAKALKTLN
jgi:glutamate dehydrogenase/leucine dehydrogenase